MRLRERQYFKKHKQMTLIHYAQFTLTLNRTRIMFIDINNQHINILRRTKIRATKREICFPAQRLIHHDGQRVSQNAFKCRLTMCCKQSSSVPHRPSRRLHYDFFARECGGENGARATTTPADRAAAAAAAAAAQPTTNAAKLHQLT